MAKNNTNTKKTPIPNEMKRLRDFHQVLEKLGFTVDARAATATLDGVRLSITTKVPVDGRYVVDLQKTVARAKASRPAGGDAASMPAKAAASPS